MLCLRYHKVLLVGILERELDKVHNFIFNTVLYIYILNIFKVLQGIIRNSEVREKQGK